MRWTLFLLLAVACGTGRPGTDAPVGGRTLLQTGAEGLRAIRPEALRAHVLFLADDALEGRAPGSAGHRIAARYVTTQLAALGLEPAGERGGFEQAVPLRSMVRDDADSSLEVDGKPVAPGNVILPPFASRVDVKGPLVYGGYGITAPDQKYDDAAGADLHGAIAVVMRGAPPSFAPPTARALYSDFELKAERLAARGAAAVIVVVTPEGEKQRPWAQRQADSRFESMVWMNGDRPGSGPTIPVAIVNMAGLQVLLGDGDAAALWSEAAAGRARPRKLGKAAHLRIASTYRDLSSSNVAAVLPGGDPALAGEYVVFTAHLDHLGVGTPVAGDAIYNGALDDAVGVAALLEIARAFASMPVKPPRSLLFLTVTAEEEGLLGSDYYAHHPTVPIRSIVADVNLDAPNPLYEMFDTVPLGAAHSSLRRNVDEAAAALKIAVSEDPVPEQGFFIRSDQYSFVKQGVPSIFPLAGERDASGSTKRNHAIFEGWMAKHYHQPSDEWRDGEYGADWLAKEVRLDFLIGLSIARAPARPAWNAGDVFAATFAAAGAR
ncbi:MAG TPA: M28 family peptidase [Kofleriaceae bacterium]|jgi:Zn-dependent M28 family amino/carboxypeptidase